MNTDIKILIADDSAFMRKVLRSILEGIGFSHFTECSNGRECLKKYREERPDLILLDIVMPEIDGLGVLKEIGTAAKILVISAVGQEKLIEEAKGYGAKGYIIKPFDNQKVVEEIKKVLE
ncbi:response regulator [Candidatus Wolfebacteria bacterium]|nr:response regulator [Candidatus Wolfebacteria bacterium]